MASRDLVDRYRVRLARLDGFVDPLLRIGLGLVVLLAGLHKLVAPGDWAVFVVPPFDVVLPTTPRQFMLANGVLELPFGAALLADRYTTLAAATVALSLAATVGYLAVASALGGTFVDELIRDIGLVALATGVTIRSAGETA